MVTPQADWVGPSRADRAILTILGHISTTMGLVDFFLTLKDLAM